MMRWLVAVAALLIVADVGAQQPTDEHGPIAICCFEPAPAGDRYFRTASPMTPGHLVLRVMLLGQYSREPLVLRDEADEKRSSIVSYQALMHLNASLSLFDRLSLHVDAPVAVAQNGDGPVVSGKVFALPSAPAIGDVRVGARGRIVGEPGGFFQLGVGSYVWFPSAGGGPGSYLGNGYVRSKPYVAMAGTALRFLWAVDLGVESRRRQQVLDVVQATMLTLRAANAVVLGKDRQVQLSMELAGSLTPEAPAERNTNAELLAGVRWRMSDDFIIGGAAGPGVLMGLGTPALRVVTSLAFSPR